MSKSITLLVMLAFAGVVAACTSQEEEFVVVEPEPISSEPEYTGKFK